MGGHADDTTAVEAIRLGAKVRGGAEVGTQAWLVTSLYPEVCVRLIPVESGTSAAGGVDGGAGNKGEAEGLVPGVVGERRGGVGGGELEVGSKVGGGDAGDGA